MNSDQNLCTELVNFVSFPSILSKYASNSCCAEPSESCEDSYTLFKRSAFCNILAAIFERFLPARFSNKRFKLFVPNSLSVSTISSYMSAIPCNQSVTFGLKPTDHNKLWRLVISG